MSRIIFLKFRKIIKKNNNPFNIFEDEDDFGNFKSKSKIIKKFFNKISKNKFVIIAFLIICITYYYFLFYSVLPLYEASFFIELNGLNNEKKNINLRFEYYKCNDNMRKEIIDFDYKNHITNKGLIYAIIFHLFFMLFLYSFIKLSIMNPGIISDEYNDVFNISKYYEYYIRFYNKILLDKKTINESYNKDLIKENYTPFVQIKSSSLLQKKVKNIELANNKY